MAALCAGNPPVFVCAGNCRYPYLCSAGALCGVEHLIVAQDESGTPVGFMGVQENRLEMLFLDPETRGRGLGARLLCLGMEQYGVSELTVNEQNPAARPDFVYAAGVKHCSALPYGARAKILSILMACRPVSCYTVFIYL